MKVTGWTCWYDKEDLVQSEFEEMPWNDSTIEWYKEANHVVIDEIREHNYHFTGDMHQHYDMGVPIIDEKYLYQLSQREWGQLMADAYPEEDYAKYEAQAIEQGYPADYYHYLKWAWLVPEDTNVLMPGDDSDWWEDFDWCYECTGYGDDYSVDDNGNLVSNCDGCPHNWKNTQDD